MPFLKSIEVECGAKIYLWGVTEDSEALQILCDESGVEYTEEELDMPEHRLAEILATRLLLNHIFGADIRLLHHENGAPYIVGEDYISISHTKGCIAIAVYEYDMVGVDIEVVNSRVLRIKDKFLNDSEKLFIATDDIQRTLMAWCAKEALFKAIPENGIDFRENLLLEPFDIVTVDAPISFNANFLKGDSDDKYQLWSYKYENYIIIFTTLSNG
ncbi:MAG: 4'-phosphopantetheinyl transferase superfamily protein [Bacteroidales bacterium]